MELIDYWRTVRRRWKLIAVCVLLSVGAAALLTWQTTPLYASNAQLFVSTASASTSDASTGGQFATQRVASYVDLVGTRKLSETVAGNLGGEYDPAELRSDVSAEAVPDTVNFVITVENPDPVAARDIAQAYANAMKDLVAMIETPSGRADAPIMASIVDDAALTSAPVSPNKTRNLGLGLVLGLLIGVGAAVLRDLLDTTMRTAEDVADVTSAPILGHINSDSAAVRKSQADALAEATPWAEAFRVLRTNMQYVEVDQEHRVFVVSSSLPAEGKSTATVNLAVTLAMAGESVCLVECDLRRPTMASRLFLDDAVGTTSVLIGKVSLDDALQSYGDTGLKVLACGQRPPNPSELLQSNAMSDLIADLRERFDIVLIDSPPLLPVTDAALLSAQADGMLVVVRHGKTTRDQLTHSLERVESVGAKCVGVVINLVPSKKSGSGYGYGYGYGYQYTYEPTTPKASRVSRFMGKGSDKGSDKGSSGQRKK